MSEKSIIKRKAGLLILSLLLINFCFSQNNSTKSGNNAISVGIHFPVGNFSNTHFIGLGADYSPARHRFGLLKNKNFALTYNGGATYYLSKKETVSSYSYHYPSYFFIHAFAGFLYKTAKKITTTLFAGPALAIYNGHIQFNTATKLEFIFLIHTKIAIGPGIIAMKASGSDPLWSASLKATMIL